MIDSFENSDRGDTLENFGTQNLKSPGNLRYMDNLFSVSFKKNKYYMICNIKLVALEFRLEIPKHAVYSTGSIRFPSSEIFRSLFHSPCFSIPWSAF